MFIMKKQITFLVALLATTFMVAQVPTIDFDPDGSLDGGLVDGDCSNPRFSVIADPEGTNGNVGSLNAEATDWHAFEVELTHEIDFSDPTKKVLSFDFYQYADDFTARPILVKVGSGTGDTFAGDGYEVNVQAAEQAGWQTITADFSNAAPSYPNNQNPAEDISGSYTKLYIFINPGSPTASLTAIDNIGGGTQGAAIVGDPDTWPGGSAPTPTAEQEKVVSVFSDHYTQGFPAGPANHGWGQGTIITEIEIAPCDFVTKGKNLEYINYSDASYGSMDVTTTTHLRIDYWTETSFEGDVTLEAPAGTAHSVPVSYVGDSQWHTIEIPLSDYTTGNANMDFGTFQHMKIGNTEYVAGGSNPILYTDNVYFVNTSTSTNTDVTFEVDTAKSSQDYSGAVISISADLDGSGQYSTSIALNDDGNGLFTGSYTVDYSTSPNFDYWVTYEDANFNVYNSQRSASCDATLTADEAFNVVIENLPNATERIQLLDVDPASGNAFACYNTDSFVTTPQVSAPSPTDITGNVMSLYSDYYAPDVERGAVENISVITWDASWGPSETGEVDLGGDMVRYYTSSYTGIDVTPVDLSSYDMMHIDLWSQNGGTFEVKLVDFLGDGYAGGNGDTEAAIVHTHAVSTWKTVDVPLGTYEVNGMTSRSDVNQIVISSTGGTTYIDNVYFYQSDALSTAELNELGVKAYPNPTRNNWMINASSNIKSIEVYNVLGKQVLAVEANSNKVVLSGAALNNGIYFARVNAENGSKTLKLVKN